MGPLLAFGLEEASWLSLIGLGGIGFCCGLLDSVQFVA